MFKKSVPTAPLAIPLTTIVVFFLLPTHPPMALTKDILGLGRTKSGKLSVTQRSAIIYAHQAGATQSKLALDFRYSRRTIYNTLKRFKEHNTVKSLPRTGRPRIFSDRTYHLLFILARRHPF